MNTNYQALIIEDDNDLAAIYALILQAYRVTAEIVSDGRAAEQRIEGDAPHLLLLDMHLPYVSGLEILKKIQRNGRWPQTKIVVITADPNMLMDVEDRVDITLVKPVNFEQMDGLLKRLMGTNHQFE